MNRSFIYVREYTLKPLSDPGFLFSNAGFSGNL
jgi:hypothetical protein